jgi:hypothetical protein
MSLNSFQLGREVGQDLFHLAIGVKLSTDKEPEGDAEHAQVEI